MKKNGLFSLIVEKRIFFGYVAAAIFLILAGPSKASVFLGFLFCLMGEAIRTIASGTIMKNKVLTTAGPYGYVRNPLYLGSFLIGIGVCIMGNILIFTLVFIPLFLIVYNEKIKREEIYLRSLFGESMDEYILNVPSLFPQFTPWKKEKMKFEARLFKVHKEYKAWLGIYAITIIMLIKT